VNTSHNPHSAASTPDPLMVIYTIQAMPRRYFRAVRE
jgi:hypothetical protein